MEKNGAVDPIEVTFSMCDVLGHLYRKFMDPCAEQQHIHEAVMKVDARIKVGGRTACACVSAAVHARDAVDRCRVRPLSSGRSPRI